MGTNDLRSLLDRLQGIRHACDLDLLLFFSRHPSALLTDDQLVAALGYAPDCIAESLDSLIEAGFLTRTQKSERAARLYNLQLQAAPGGFLAALLKKAATRLGRRETMRLLKPASLGQPLPQAGPNPAHLANEPRN